jgi:hypothetical protein
VPVPPDFILAFIASGALWAFVSGVVLAAYFMWGMK